MKYILINTINDIDPNRISIRDVNIRYIDREGNRFATRFNMKSRKIEIVRIASNKEEALRIRNEILQDRKIQIQENAAKNLREESYIDSNEESNNDEMYMQTELYSDSSVSENKVNNTSGRTEHQSKDTTASRLPSGPDFDPYQDDFGYEAPTTSHSLSQQELEKEVEREEYTGDVFDENKFLDEISHQLTRIVERVDAIINNLKKSHFFESSRNDQFYDLTRKLDSEGKQPAENSLNLYKEIYFYPRTLSYYLAKITDQRKRKVELVSNDDEKMSMIRRWEVQDSLESTYDRVLKVTGEMMRFLERISDQDLMQLPVSQRQLVENSRTSCNLLINDCNRTIAKLQIWKKKTKG